MGFRKALYDVEEKGLDPVVPHSDLAGDGRLQPKDDVLDTPAAVVAPSKAEPAQDNSAGVVVSKPGKEVAETPQLSVADVVENEKIMDEPQNVLKELPDSPSTKAKPKKRATKPPAKKMAHNTKAKTTKGPTSSKASRSATTKKPGRGTKKEE